MFKHKYRYLIATLLFLASAINYIDRAAIGIVTPLLRKDLHLSPSQMGIAFSGFFIGYSLFAFVGGHLSDRFGPRGVMSWAMGLWSLLCGLTGATTGFASLLVVRVLFGFGEGPGLSTTSRTVANWFPKREAGSVLGTILAGQMFGSAIAGPLIALLALAAGWRGAFAGTALAGFVWLVCWRFAATDRPNQNRRVDAVERHTIESDQADSVRADNPLLGDGATLRDYLLCSGPFGVGLGLFAVNYTLYVLISWLPTYLVDVHHVGVARMGMLTAIPWIAGALGSVLGGIGSDWLLRGSSSRDALRARKLSTWVPLALSCASVLMFSFATSLAAAVMCVTFALLFVSAAGQACWSITHELVPRRFIGGLGGFVHLLGNVAGIVGPAATGFAIQYLGGFSVAFRLCGAIDAIAVIAVLVLVRRPGVRARSSSMETQS